MAKDKRFNKNRFGDYFVLTFLLLSLNNFINLHIVVLLSTSYKDGKTAIRCGDEQNLLGTDNKLYQYTVVKRFAFVTFRENVLIIKTILETTYYIIFESDLYNVESHNNALKSYYNEI